MSKYLFIKRKISVIQNQITIHFFPRDTAEHVCFCIYYIVFVVARNEMNSNLFYSLQ